MRAQERGNALFLILIAVALFAALSYAVTQSGRSSGTIDRESAMILAAQITQEAAAYRVAVDRMLLTGTDKTALQFENSGTAFLCTAGTDCFWALEGGGNTPPTPPAAAFTRAPNPAFETFNGAICHPYDGGVCTGFGVALSVTGIGTTAKDTFIIYYPLTKAVCEAINKGLGISGIPFQSPFDSTIDGGHAAACLQGLNGGGTYNYYHVLIEN